MVWRITEESVLARYHVASCDGTRRVGARFAQSVEQESRSVTIAHDSDRAISAGEPWPRVGPLKHGTVRVMAAKADRRAARERVSAYHESQLAGLLGHVGAEIDRYRAGEIDAYAADEIIHHYHRAPQNCGSSASPQAAAHASSSSPASSTA